MQDKDLNRNNNSDLENDPRYNPFYYWGLIFLTSGLLNLTIMPLLIHRYFIYPPAPFFFIPSAVLFFLTFIIWRLASETEVYQVIVTGYGLVYYGVFQIFIEFLKYGKIELSIYPVICFIGVILILSGFDFFKNTTRHTINVPMLFVSSLFSIILAFLILYFALFVA